MTEQFERMMSEVKAISLRYLLLQALDLVIFEFDDPVAADADEMIVVRTWSQNFENRFAISKLFLID